MKWIALALALCPPAQDKKPGVDPKRVDEAIRKGIDFLRSAPSPSASKNIANSDELILLAWVHGDGSQAEARFRELFDRMLRAPFTHTYKVALQAMILEEVDRVRYQERIAQCAQALVDSQLKHGQWNYECSSDGKPDMTVATPAPGPKAASGKKKGSPPAALRGTPAEGARAKPAVTRHIAIKRTRFGASDRGDDSNSQYAALGLRACHDAGILIPAEVIELARTWWENSQQPKPDPNERPAVATGGQITGIARGWDYSKGGTAQEKPFGSMTAGAVSAVVIYDSMLKRDWRQDRVVLDGMVWLSEHFTVTTNPGKYPEWHYYYLYARERVGMLYNTWTIGSHDWYREGALHLLDAQKADGSWRSAGSKYDGATTWDTCFAILFLKRATRSLDVASFDPARR